MCYFEKTLNIHPPFCCVSCRADNQYSQVTCSDIVSDKTKHTVLRGESFMRGLDPVYMDWGTPVWWGRFLLFCVPQNVKTKETNPTRPGSPTPCKQALRDLKKRRFEWRTVTERAIMPLDSWRRKIHGAVPLQNNLKVFLFLSSVAFKCWRTSAANEASSSIHCR